MGSLAIKLVPILSLLAWSAPASQQKQEQHGENIQGPAAILGLAKIEQDGITTEKISSPLMKNKSLHFGSEGKRRTRSVSKATDSFDQPDFIFDLPDVVTSYRSETRQIQIEAFPARGNSAILDSKAPKSLQSRLYWVSIGHPRFVKTLGTSDDHEDDEEGIAAAEKNQLFHFTNEGIHTYIEMLTQAQQKLLTEQASFKYGLDIKTSQVAHLSLSQFTCSLRLTDFNGDKHMLKGEVADFRSYPLRMDFEAFAGSKGRQLFETRLMGKGNSGKRGNFKFQCYMATAGKLVEVNTLQVRQAAFNRTTALYTVDNLEGSQSALLEIQGKMKGIENSLLTFGKWKEELDEEIDRLKKEKTPKMDTPHLQLDTHPFTDENLWKLGIKKNWEALKRILEPLVNEDFAVTDTTTQVFLDDVRKRFDSSASSSDGNYIILKIQLQSSSNTSSSEPLLKMLVSAGINPDVQNKNGWRPSHTCGQEGAVEWARIIFPCRPDLKAMNEHGDTPMEAAKSTYKNDEDRHNVVARRPLVVKVIKETTSNGTAENGFPSIAELAYKEMFFAVKNLIRRRVVPEAEFKEHFNGKTADEWASHFKLPMLQQEILYYKAERAGSVEEVRLQLEQIRKKLENKE